MRPRCGAPQGASAWGRGRLTVGAELALLEAERAAWNADDVDGVLATMTGDAVLWAEPNSDAAYTGAALRQFIADNLWFDVEITGGPAMSGPFAAVANLLAAESSGEGISVYWIRDGKIALHVYAQGM